MKILMLAPIKRPLTADTTVSRARVIVDLTNGLLTKGHQVSIMATSDSSLRGAEIIGVVEKGLNFMEAAENPFYRDTAYLTQMVEKVIELQRDFDLIHNHMYPEFLPLLLGDRLEIPMVTTIHSQMVFETASTFKLFPLSNLVTISESAQKLSGLTNLQVIHNSVDTDFFVPDNQVKREYLLAIGRMSKAKKNDGTFLDPKGIQNAIQIAQKSGMALKIVGNVEDPAFFETLVKPYLNDKIQFVGEVSSEQLLTRHDIKKLFQGALAFINPINWEEPFGLVMAEALACGTPVVAYNRGAVSEIITHGETGFIIEPREGIDGMVEALKNISIIDPSRCRVEAVARFSSKRMVEEYEKLYITITQG